MKLLTKTLPLLLTALLAASTLITVQSASAQTISKPSVPEFTVRYIDNSYDVPPTTMSSTDPYTGKTTTTTIPGYHVENKTIEAVITNTPDASYYNFRYKGYYTNGWSYFPFDPNSVNGYNFYDAFYVPFQAASNSQYTILPLFFLPSSIPAGGQVDVQVQALFGNYDAIPYGHVIDVGGPTYDFIFKGEASGWSNTQTVTIGENSTSTTPAPTLTPASTPTPTQTPTSTTAVSEIPAIAVLILLFSLASVAVIIEAKNKEVDKA